MSAKPDHFHHPYCLVTRPAHQNQALNRLLEQSGFKALNFPTISITPSPNSDALQSLSSDIKRYDIALFVSRNAVDYAFQHFTSDQLPAHLQIGGIGKGTLAALQQHGVESAIIPCSEFNSEGLLQSATLNQVNAKRIAIFRGQQGRTLLGDTLQQRGAEVDHYEVYRRTIPEYPTDHFDTLTRTHFPDIALFTSSEGLENAYAILDQSQGDRLRHIPWLLISERMRETARNLRHNADIIIAASASDEGIITALNDWRINHHPGNN